MTPYELFLREQSMGGLPPTRPAMPPAPTMPTSPYLTPSQSAMVGGTGYLPMLGTEMAPSLPAAEQPAAAPTTPMGGMTGGFANGFTPATLGGMTRPMEQGKGPFEDWARTYQTGRTPAAPPALGAQPPASSPPPPVSVGNQPRVQQGGFGGGMGMDAGQMRREQMLAQRFPRAMERVNQLRGMSQRRGY